MLAQFDEGDEARAEAQWKRKDGSRVSVQSQRPRLVRAPSGEIECFEGLVEDVTEQRSLENQFRQAQRMEAVGRLAGGVAHDFNNVLTAIIGYSDLLLEDLGPGRSQAAGRAGDQGRPRSGRPALTRQLLAFSRKQVLQTRVLDLNDVVRTLEKMLQRLIGEDVKLELALAPAVGAVRADPGQIEQVILNLAVNSRDAMPRRRATHDRDGQRGPRRRRTSGSMPGRRRGRYVMLAVSDTGIGMDAETQLAHLRALLHDQGAGQGHRAGLWRRCTAS